jgi:peptide/nickel transport system permease protein
MQKSDSLYKEAWKKLKKDNVSRIGMGVILLMIFVAIMGPLIRPDNTPNADQQVLQLKSKSPGFSIDMLYKIRNAEPRSSNVFSTIIFGKESEYAQPIPLMSYWFEADQIFMVRYMGSETLTDTISENLCNVLYPISYDQKIAFDGKVLKGKTITGEDIEISREEAIKEIEDHHIKSKTFLLGTDRNGRDFLSRIMAGTRVSLGVGFIAVIISILLGIVLGALAGFYGGWVDNAITWVISVFWSIPALLLVIAITLSLGKGVEVVFIAVGLTMWVEVARIVRGQFLSLSQFEFVEAGRALGFKQNRIIFKHILPNTVGPIIVVSVSNFATAILLEAGLSFLGLGAQPPQASWGEMVGTYSGYLVGDNPHLAILPGLAIVITVIAFFMLGNGLRDAFDVRDSKD